MKDSFRSVIMVFVFIVLPFLIFSTLTFVKDAERFHLINREMVYRVGDIISGQKIILYPKVDKLMFIDEHYKIDFEISNAPAEIIKMIRGKRIAPLERYIYNSPHIGGYAGRQKIVEYPELELVIFFDCEIIIGRWKTKDVPEAIQKIISGNKEK